MAKQAEPCTSRAIKQFMDTVCGVNTWRQKRRRRQTRAIDKVKSMKRTNYLSWDEYFMAVALLSAQRSKDPNTQVGACVANDQNKIVGVGYNGFPLGCSDDAVAMAKTGEIP